MRFALLVVLAGCLGGSPSAPSWPKQHTSEADGGESLAPHVPGTTAVASTTSDEDKPAAAVVATPTAATPAATPTAATPAVTPATEEPLQTEDIIIEIDE